SRNFFKQDDAAPRTRLESIGTHGPVGPLCSGHRLNCGNGPRCSAMRGRTIIIGGILTAAFLLPDVTRAQFSPQGIIGGITRPFRHALGQFRNYPRARHHHRTATRASAGESRAAAAREIPGIAGSRLGWVGPPAWPTAYEDMLGFTFWPNEYATRLRGHGFDVIADTITGRFDLPRSLARTATTGSAV